MIDDILKKDEEQKMEEPTVEEKKAPITDDEITDVDLGFVEKRKFRIAGDYNRILEINVSDLNIARRLKVGYPKLQELLKEAQETIAKLPDDDTDEDALTNLGKFADILDDIDKKMRDTIDYIFDTNASEVCAPSGSMYDAVNGSFRFEHIIDKLADLYTTGLDVEFKKLKNNIEKKASKYTKKSKK